MNESNMELSVSLVAIFVSTISLIVSWRTMSKTSLWQKEDLEIRQNAEKNKRLIPYIDLVHNTYCDFKELFSDYSSTANCFFDDIVDLADSYDNGNGTNKHALRHYMAYACYDVIDELDKDILFQHPLALFTNIFNGRYRKIDYKLDLKGKSNLNSIENHLKVLHENMNSEEKVLYLEEMKMQIKNVHGIYHDNKDKIDSAIKTLEEAMIKYEHYDFDRTITDFYLEFLGLLNLLRYIQDVSTGYTNDAYKGYESLVLSEVFYKISSVMIVNQGILKLSKY